MPVVITEQKTDGEMAADMIRGHKQAFNGLYTAYAPILYGHLLRIVGNAEVAERILQASFIRIWDSRNSYAPGKGTLLNWMLGIVEKEAGTAREIKQKNEIQSAAGFVDVGKENYTAGVFNDIGSVNGYDATGMHRAVLDLMYFKKYSLQQAAAMLNIDEDSVKSMLRSAMNNVKSLTR